MTASLAALTAPIDAVFTDVDGTLTTQGRIRASTYAALERLATAGIPVILVTGRPAGWGQALMSLAPVTAVVAENGGIGFFRRDDSVETFYGVPAASLPEWQRKMRAAAVDAMNAVPGARFSTDNRYREVDLAIDWNEEIHLSVDQADQIVASLRNAGFTATRSSVHVNFSPPEFNKFTACLHVIERVLGGDPNDRSRYIYVGDALNDAPMFAGFPKSIGVANVRRWWDALDHKPAIITDESEGNGLEQVFARVLELCNAG